MKSKWIIFITYISRNNYCMRYHSKTWRKLNIVILIVCCSLIDNAGFDHYTGGAADRLIPASVSHYKLLSPENTRYKVKNLLFHIMELLIVFKNYGHQNWM